MHLIDFIIADDIRHELGNKISIMGVYQDSILLEIPSDLDGAIPLRLAAFIRLRVDTEDKEPNKFAVDINCAGENIARFEGSVLSKGETPVLTLPLVASMLPITNYGAITFDLKIMNDDNLLFEYSESLEIMAPK